MTDSKIALIGFGYTMKRVVNLLGGERVIVTRRSLDSTSTTQYQDLVSASLELSNHDSIDAFLGNNSQIEVLVDGTPPGGERGYFYQQVKKRLKNLNRIIYLSTTGVYGVEDGSEVSEEAVPKPLHARSQSRLDVEKNYLSLEVPATIFRVPAIYGPGRGIGNSLKMGRYQLIDSGDRWSNRIHVDDLSQAIRSAIVSKSSLPSIINVSDDLPTKSRDVVSFYCDRFGLSWPSQISINEARQRGLDTLLSNQRIQNRLLKSTLLSSLRYPSYREGAGTEFIE